MSMTISIPVSAKQQEQMALMPNAHWPYIVYQAFQQKLKLKLKELKQKRGPRRWKTISIRIVGTRPYLQSRFNLHEAVRDGRRDYPIFISLMKDRQTTKSKKKENANVQEIRSHARRLAGRV